MTTRYMIDIGMATLDVEVADDADMDGTFTAKCLDTGETLSINGWLIDDMEIV